MNDKNLKDLVEKQIDNFLYAGEVALDLRNKGLNKEIKSDGTPVSNGDLEVNRIITKKISELTPDLPIVSEETSHNKLTKNLTNFWLVDPIDGTYDYINNLDEFTINAGLILNRKPVAGLIYAPAKRRMFYSYGKGMAYELKDGKIIIGEGDKWLEILGCGMVHPNVLKNVKVNTSKYQGYAFGIGIDRLAMLKYGINDLRAFFETDYRWISHFGFDPLDVPSNYRGLSR